MKELIYSEKKRIGRRVKDLRKLLSLSHSQLGKATGISKGTINSIEQGRGFNADYILSISHFFGMSLFELVNYNLATPDEQDFRARIKKYHKRFKSDAYKILDERPNLKTLIESRLVKTKFLLNRPRSVKEIIDFCNSEYGISFKSSTTSQALKNAVKSGTLKRISKDKRNYLYQAVKPT